LAALLEDEASLQRAAKIICDISGQRLRMRNEQFNFPLDPAELAALDWSARQRINFL
ncbi:MAG: hypothetical protein QOF64_2101, partial [Candidatus Binatota bacterium]|nr:hypothetical protein [Candidatus Binatota bacterium]